MGKGNTEMEKAKYIIVIERGHEVPVIFSSFIDHYRMSGGMPVVAAGFCEAWGIEPIDTSLDTLRVWAGGKSITLKDEKNNYIVSRGDIDADIIKEMLEAS